MKTSAGKETISLAQAVFKGFDLNLAIREGSMSVRNILFSLLCVKETSNMCPFYSLMER